VTGGIICHYGANKKRPEKGAVKRGQGSMGKGLVLMTALLLSGCGAMTGAVSSLSGEPGVTMVTFIGVRYPVTVVDAEPAPDFATVELLELPDGGRAVPPGTPLTETAPAIRVSNAAARQTATDVVATYCQGRGMAIAPGWRDVTMRFDDMTADHVFYMTC
jgi:hypothetical protein